MKKKHVASEAGTSSKTNRNLRMILFLICGTLITSALYFWLVTVSYLAMKITFISYSVIIGGAIIAYFIYNRGLVGREITEDMLSDTMGPAEKAAYLKDIAERKRKSRCLIAVLFIFLVPITLDLMKLFVIDVLFPGKF